MTVHVVISGLVQGVGFRYFLKRKAKELGITGWVQNTGATVEAVFAGEKVQIGKMITLCREGPPLAQVHDIRVSENLKEEKYEGFTIRKS